jgi:hypothetical protein
MKTEIKVAVSYKEVVHVIKEVDLPESDLYFMKGNMDEYVGDVTLFAIIQTHRIASGMYTIAKIKRNSQEVTDFIPRSDLKDSYWVENGNSLRKDAFDLIQKGNYSWGYKQITYDEFIHYRGLLLDNFKKDILN